MPLRKAEREAYCMTMTEIRSARFYLIGEGLMREQQETTGNKNELQRIFEEYSSVASAGALGALAWLLADQGVGAAIAAPALVETVRVALVSAFGDLRKRTLSSREERRVMNSFASAATKVYALLEAGAQPRNDNFFSGGTGEGAFPGDELLEGVLLKCRDQYEEKKTPFLENILVKTIFDSRISDPVANQALQFASLVTYRQLCLMSLAMRYEEVQFDGSLLNPGLVSPNIEARAIQ